MNIPVLFLVFNRPASTNIVFEKIRSYKPKKLFVAIDGPRKNNINDMASISKVFETVSNVDWDCELRILRREANLGCGKAISQAISWFFSQVDEGIILEDDCVPSDEFFVFCTEMLVKYRFEKSIMAINGSNPLGGLELKSSYFYSKYNFVWGWATWRRAWVNYNYELNSEGRLTVLINLIKSFKFDIVSIRSWYKHLCLVLINKIDTWDYQWMYTCWKYKGLVITPSGNLIRNIGNDEEPTHGIVNSKYLNLPHFKLDYPIVAPLEKTRNVTIDRKIKRYRFGNYLPYFLKEKAKKILHSYFN